jgi:antirestriction protein
MSSFGERIRNPESGMDYFEFFGVDGQGRYDRVDTDSDYASLLIFTSPITLLAHALAQDKLAEFSFEEWITSGQRALNKIRQSEQRIFVVENHAALTRHQLSALSIHIDQLPAGVFAEHVRGTSMLEVAAALLVTQNRIVSLLLDELKARCPRVDDFKTDARSKEFIASASAEHARTISDFQNLSRKAEEESLIADRLSAELVNARKKLQSAASDANLLKSEQTSLKRERDALKERTEHLQNSIEQIYSSTSWRISAPIRFLRRMASGS